MAIPATTRAISSICLAVLAAGCTGEKWNAPGETSWMAMGTFASVQTAGSDSGRIDKYAAETRSLFEAVEREMSAFGPASDISRLNSSQPGSWVEVSPRTEAVLNMALGMARQSGGAFDPTVGPLMAIWGFRAAKIDKPPSSADIETAMRAVGFKHVAMNGRKAAMDVPGCRLDLGGVAKGYAVDIAYERLVAMGAKNILVNLGGNMRCRGDGGGRDGWVLGIRNPFNRDAILGSVRLTDGMAVATSGHYERFVVMEGKKYAHIMDPRTGRPVVGMAGVTVIAPKAGDADVLSTTLFVLGPEEGQKLLTRFPGAHALFVPDEQPPRLIMSPGFGGYLTPPHDSAE